MGFHFQFPYNWGSGISNLEQNFCFDAFAEEEMSVEFIELTPKGTYIPRVVATSFLLASVSEGGRLVLSHYT